MGFTCPQVVITEPVYITQAANENEDDDGAGACLTVTVVTLALSLFVAM